MNRKKIIGISLGLLGIIVVIALLLRVTTNQDNAKIEEFRREVFCSQITTGMSPSDAREVFAQHGDHIETDARFNGLYVIGVYYTDPNARELLGNYFTLVFQDDKYVDARVPVPMSDSYRSLCK